MREEESTKQPTCSDTSNAHNKCRPLIPAERRFLRDTLQLRIRLRRFPLKNVTDVLFSLFLSPQADSRSKKRPVVARFWLENDDEEITMVHSWLLEAPVQWSIHGYLKPRTVLAIVLENICVYTLVTTLRSAHIYWHLSQIRSESPIPSTARTPVLLVTVLELTIVLLVHFTPDTTLYFTDLLASQQGEPGSIPGRVPPRFSQVGIMPDDAYSRGLPFPPSFHSGSVPVSSYFTLIGSQDLVIGNPARRTPLDIPRDETCAGGTVATEMLLDDQEGGGEASCRWRRAATPLEGNVGVGVAHVAMATARGSTARDVNTRRAPSIRAVAAASPANMAELMRASPPPPQPSASNSTTSRARPTRDPYSSRLASPVHNKLPQFIPELYEEEVDNSKQRNADVAIASSSHATSRDQTKTKRHNQRKRKKTKHQVVRLLASHQCEPAVRFPAGSLPDFRTWEPWRTMPLISVFPRGSSVSPALCIPALLDTHLASPSSALKSSMPSKYLHLVV
ncbi:hypothetical protein PR048_024068 [Dryococelus australis]|uniref:Uncharacterized protein n=1 Tax=Dryococelus australis TaxID=614101 RepID=A0ABQ9GW04_9NEOP|nr:hypothetical protein PR048_024068 [Dryococelus australis]